MKRLALIIIVFVIIIYFQYQSIQKEVNEFQILQFKNPDKDMVEKILLEKKITIFTDLDLLSIKYKNNPVVMITPKLYASLSQEQHTSVLKELKKFFGYYYLPMNTKSDISINYEKSKTRTNLKRQTHYRFCICQFLGLRRIYLFPPNSRDNLYYDKQSDSFDINFWEQNTEKYPLVKEAKYIEILLYPGQAIFIPNGWVFCYEMEENGMSVSFYSESIFSNMFKI
jgi:hypothetical protein